jgi:V8-like Glu-specific endopeptidase
VNATPLTIILAVCAYLTEPTPPVPELAANRPTDSASSSNETSKSGSEAATSTQTNPVAACWQIVAYDSDHDPLFIASAFAISDNLLGTNAHVVKPAAKALREGGFVHAVQNETGIEHHISRMWLHPGYDEEKSVSPDVGVIEVTESLPSFLALASDATLHRLAVLDEVRMYGFPGDVARAIDREQLLHGGLRPRATCLAGRITSLRPFDASRDASPGNTLLIQHDIPVTHGMSGSPVVDRKGEVVAVFSSLTHDELGQNGFAVRTDVLRGLLGMVTRDVLPPVDMEYDLRPEPTKGELGFATFTDETPDAVVAWAVASILCIGMICLTLLQLARIRATPKRRLLESMTRLVDVLGHKAAPTETNNSTCLAGESTNAKPK